VKVAEPQSYDSTVNVVLVSPIPPPYGGIASWTSMVLKYSELHGTASTILVDTSLRLRPSHSRSRLGRLFLGTLEGAGIMFRLLVATFKRRPDIVHLNSAASIGLIRDIAIVTLARARRIPVVYHLRFGRVPEMVAYNTREWRLLVKVARSASAVIVIDRPTFAVFAQHAPQVKCHLVPNCIDMNTIPVKASEPLAVVLYVGSIIRSKGLTDLIVAWNSVCTTGWQLVLIGEYEESYRDELLSFSNDASSVSILGGLPRYQVLRHMSESAILALPSHTEGFPNVVVEAMACGLPVIATQVGAVPEILEGNAGLIVPPKDCRALADALSLLMGDNDLRTELGNRARRKVQANYALESVYREYELIWQETSGSQLRRVGIDVALCAKAVSAWRDRAGRLPGSRR